MPILDRLMKQEAKKTEVQTVNNKQQVTKQLAIANKQEVKKPTNKPDVKKPESKQAPKQKTLGPAQLAAIAAISGQAEADRIQALLAGGQAPKAVKHLTDVLAPEYSLVAEFITPDEKPSRKQLEADIASWYLEQNLEQNKVK